MTERVVWVSLTNNLLTKRYHYNESHYVKSSVVRRRIPTLESYARLAGMIACDSCHMGMRNTVLAKFKKAVAGGD